MTILEFLDYATIALFAGTGALRYGWCFPVYKARPGRHPDDVM